MNNIEIERFQIEKEKNSGNVKFFISVIYQCPEHCQKWENENSSMTCDAKYQYSYKERECIPSYKNKTEIENSYKIIKSCGTGKYSCVFLNSKFCLCDWRCIYCSHSGCGGDACGRCNSCIPGYYVNYKDYCYPCDPQCLTCFGGSNEQCYCCAHCIPCTPPCQTCNTGENKTCLSCIDGLLFK